MKPTMSPGEFALFQSIIRPAATYVEFGSGGSTVTASSMVRDAVLSVDTSAEWLERVRVACIEKGARVTPTLVHLDLGPLGGWGTPIDATFRPVWPRYHAAVWSSHPEVAAADLYFIDGRFRVACAMQVILRARRDAIFAVHDFSRRPKYHVIREFAREIAVVESLSVFSVRENIDRDRVQAVLDLHEYDRD